MISTKNLRSARSPAFSALLCAAALLLSACAKNEMPAGPKHSAAAVNHWNATSQKFLEDYFKAQPFFAVQAGRHEFDGKMRDFSSAGIDAEIKRLHGWQTDIGKIDAGSLEASQAFERSYMLSTIDRDLFWLEKARWPYRNPAWYLSEIDPDVYLSRNYASLPDRLRGYIGYARAIPSITAAIRANLQTPLPKVYVEYGIKAFGGFADFYRKDVPSVFAAVSDAGLQFKLREADEAAAKAMDELVAWFKDNMASATDQYAIGAELFGQMLHDTERVDAPLAQIEAIGQADLERNTAKLAQVCTAYAPKASLGACVAKMEADKPKGGVVEAASAQLVQLKDFVIKNQVVSIPVDQQALVALAPPYNRANFAFINIPGPYDKGVASTYNIAPADPAWSKADQAAYVPGRGRLVSTSVHEVWPGHFLQFLHANANPSKFEALFIGYAFAEGWAHYTEEMMVDMGLGANDPAIQVGQCIDALLRDVRLLSAIGLHTHGMTVAQSEKMFSEKAFKDPGNARQQSARGAYDPAYLNYTLGKLMIRKLRSDWVAKKNLPAGSDEKKSWREFHDQFLSYGGPPIPLVAEQMVGKQGSIF